MDNRGPGRSQGPNGLVIFAIYIGVATALGGAISYLRDEPERLDKTVCMDGTRTISRGQGACSHHGGIRGYLP